MEGEFLRGVVHGKATYYLDNGTRCSVEKRTTKLKLISWLQVHWALQKRRAPWKGSRHRGRWQTGESAYMQIFWTIEHIIEHLFMFMIEGVGGVLLPRPAREAGSWTWTSRYNGEEGNNSFRNKTRWKLTCAVKLFLFQNELRLRRMSLQFSD